MELRSGAEAAGEIPRNSALGPPASEQSLSVITGQSGTHLASISILALVNQSACYFYSSSYLLLCF